MRLGDPDLADLPVGGDFIAGETDLIVSAFAAALPLRVVAGSSGEIVLFRRYRADGTRAGRGKRATPRLQNDVGR